MVFNSTVIDNNSVTNNNNMAHTLQFVINTADLKEFIKITEKIKSITRDYSSQGRRSKPSSNTAMATNTQEKIAESLNVEDAKQLNAKEHKTSYDTNKKNPAALVSSIENVIKNIDREAQEATNCSDKPSPVSKESRCKACCRSRCGRVKSNIKQLAKKYETETTPSLKTGKNEIPKLTCKTKVKQLALLFNNKFNEIVSKNKTEVKTLEPASSGLQCSANFNPTLKPKSPAKVASAKPSPLFSSSKPLEQNISSNNPTPKRKQLQDESITCRLMTEKSFSRLSVKDKALLYSKFIEDMAAKQKSKLQKHDVVLDANVKKKVPLGEVVFEKQNSVKYLRESLEARISHNKLLSKSVESCKKTTSSPVDVTSKCIVPLSSSNDGQDVIRIASLLVVLRSEKKDKIEVAFDITQASNEQHVKEKIVHKTNREDNVQPIEKVKKIHETALIKNTTENKKSTEKLIIEDKLPIAEVIHKKATEAKVPNLDLSSKKKTTSEESKTELKALESSKKKKVKPLRKKRRCRTLTWKKNNSILKASNIITTDSSDLDSKTGRCKQLNGCTLPKAKRCSNYKKKLIFKTTEKPNQSLGSPKLSAFNFNNSLIRQVNSPSKIRNAYTLTFLSTTSSCSESNFCDSDLPTTPDLKRNDKLIPNDIVTKKDNAELGNKMEPGQQKLLTESFIDQGFETGSNELNSPIKVSKNSMHFSTPYKDQQVEPDITTQRSCANLSILSPIGIEIPTQTSKSQTTTAIKAEDTTSGKSSASSTTSTTEHIFNDTESGLGNTCKNSSSQFWITSGNFTAALAIDHYDSQKLMLLSSKFSQMVLETRAMCFGIDEQKFTLNKTTGPDNLVTKVARSKEHSQYWFSNGQDILAFIGNKLTSQKIQSFFNYIREFMDDESSLRFGIDGYEFSSIDKQTANNSALFSSQTWLQPSSFSLKNNDPDQSLLDSEKNGQSLSFLILDGSDFDIASLTSQDCHSLNLNLSKTQTEKLAFKAQFSVSEMLKILQIEHVKLRTLEEEKRKNNKIKPPQLSDINYSPEYMHKLGNIISAIDNIGRNYGFNACTIEQLESFMFFLSRYSDICLAKCNANIEKILAVVRN